MKYRFQNFLELTINSNGKRQFDRYFDNEYARIDQTNESTDNPTYKISLEIVDRIPKDLPIEAIRRTVTFKKLFTFEFAIIGQGTESVTIYFKDHPVRHIYVTAVGVFVQAQVLEPIMYLSFLKQGIIFMHSAGVSKDGKAFVFPAFGGTRKTTTSISLLAKGYDFLGDDLLIVDPGGKKVYPYPRPLHIFTYNVRNLRGAKIPKSTELIIRFKNLIRFFLERLLRTEFLISTRIHVDAIMPGIKFSRPAALHNVIFLKKEGDHESIQLKLADVIEEHAQNIAISADLNASLYEILNDNSHIREIQELVRLAISTMLRNSHYFGYLNTRIIDLDQVPNYLENVEV